MLKRLLVLTLLFYINSLIVLGQTPSDKMAKEAIKMVWLVELSRMNSNLSFLEPADYIKDKSTGKIIGQHFLYGQSRKAFQVDLKWQRDSLLCGMIGMDSVYFTWNNGAVSKITSCYNLRYDYSVSGSEEEKVIKLTAKELYNGKYSSITEFHFNEGKVDRILSYQNTPKKIWIWNDKQLTSKPNELSMHVVRYHWDKPNSPKNIASDKTGTITNQGNNSFLYKSGEGTGELFYNSKNQLIKSIGDHGVRKEVNEYNYVNDTLYSESKLTTYNGVFKENRVDVYFSLPKQDASVPVYKWLKGQYILNEEGDIIFEGRDGKYRKKINGEWTAWDSYRY